MIQKLKEKDSNIDYYSMAYGASQARDDRNWHQCPNQTTSVRRRVRLFKILSSESGVGEEDVCSSDLKCSLAGISVTKSHTMSGIARTKRPGQTIEASHLDSTEWEALKARYTLGDFLTICCESPAIPKTSQNGLPFFAHHSDECSTAPETVWHKTAKTLICFYLKRKGIPAVEEHASTDRDWIADVYFETGAKKIAIELQHSYQGLPKYLERQGRYRQAGVESYWLLYPARFKTLNLSVAKWRIRNEFGGRLPDGAL